MAKLYKKMTKYGIQFFLRYNLQIRYQWKTFVLIIRRDRFCRFGYNKSIKTDEMDVEQCRYKYSKISYLLTRFFFWYSWTLTYIYGYFIQRFPLTWLLKKLRSTLKLNSFDANGALNLNMVSANFFIWWFAAGVE